MWNKRNTGLEIVLKVVKLHLDWRSFYMQNVNKLLVFGNSFCQHSLVFYMEIVVITINKSQVMYFIGSSKQIATTTNCQEVLKAQNVT